MKYTVALVDESGEARRLVRITDHPGDVARRMEGNDLEAKKLEEWQARMAVAEKRRERIRIWARAHDLSVQGIGMDALSVLYDHNRKAQLIERWHERNASTSPMASASHSTANLCKSLFHGSRLPP